MDSKPKSTGTSKDWGYGEWAILIILGLVFFGFFVVGPIVCIMSKDCKLSDYFQSSSRGYYRDPYYRRSPPRSGITFNL